MGMWFVYKCFTDRGRDGLWKPTLSGGRLSCTGCWLYLLSMMWLMYGILFLNLHRPGCFCPRIEQYTADFRYISFTYHTKANQQKCSRLLATYFPCGFVGPGINQLPPVGWSTFSFSFFKCQFVCNFGVVERGILLLVFFCIYSY